jgi:hypothetical protein
MADRVVNGGHFTPIGQHKVCGLFVCAAGC